MIVRISTEGQYELGEEDAGQLDALENAAIAAADASDDAAFREGWGKLLAFIRAKGRAVDDDHLGGSDLILPPPDVTLAEARAEFSGEGLLPS